MKLELSLAKLKKQREQADAKIYKIEQAKRQVQNRKLVGQCFKYNNSYGSGDRWWLYVIVTGRGEHWPTALRFEITSTGEAKAEVDSAFTGSEGYKPITRPELDTAWENFVNHINQLHTIKQ